MLQQVHDLTGHQGIDKTFSRLRNIAFLAGITVDVDNYVASCSKCQKAKLRAGRAPLQNTPIGKTMQLFQVDFLEVPWVQLEIVIT